MPLIKCPRCELNYMESTEKLCKVCARESNWREVAEEPEMCTICNEVPSLPGKDVCRFCLNELNEHVKEAAEAEISDVENDAAVPMDEEITPEIEPDTHDDGEFGQIGKELSLEEMEEQEAEDDADEDDDA